MRRRPAILLIPFLSACTAAQSPVALVVPKAPGRYVETIESGGRQRRFVLRVPKGYDGRKPTPVVMALHGWTGSAEAAEQYTRLADKGEKEGFVAIFPDGLGNPGYQGWNAGFINLTGIDPPPDDVAFLTSVLDKVETEINVDRDRQFVVGHSNGAFMANLLGSRLSGRLAAIASMAGTVGLGPGKTIPAPSSPISVMLLHGKQDRMVGYDVTAKALLRPIGAVESAEFWARADGASETPITTKSADGKVVTDRYTGGKNGTEVVLVSVENGTHDWWGGLARAGEKTVDVPTYGAPVADLVWDFFRNHPKRR